MPELPLPPPLPPPPVEVPLIERVRAWPRSLQVLAAVGVAVAGAVAWLVTSSAGVRAGPAPELSLPRATAADVGSAAESVAGEAYVHVAGAVVRPGVYRVPGDARVTAVLDAGGGPTDDADVDQLNLAARARDGERIYVPRRGEQPPPPSPTGTGSSAGGVVDLNTATADQLDSLPGVGPSTAQAIIEERQRRGRFRSVDELLDVRGIGDARLAQIRSKVRV